MDVINIKTGENELETQTGLTKNFYEEFNPQIRAIVSRILTYANQPNDIDDCVNTVYVELLERLQQYNETRGSMGAFVAVIARSSALNYCKTNRRRAGELIGDEKLDFMLSPIDCQNETEFDLLAESIISRLNKQEKLLFTMRYLHYYTPTEIAKVLGINRTAVDMRTTRLKDKIKKFLTKGGVII